MRVSASIDFYMQCANPCDILGMLIALYNLQVKLQPAVAQGLVCPAAMSP